MFARVLLLFQPSRLHAPSRLLSKSFISPTYARFTRNSFVSPTYARTGGFTSLKMSARRHSFSLCSQLPNLDSVSFLSFAHSFIFRSTSIPCLPSAFRTLSPRTGGTLPGVRPIPKLSDEIRSSLFAISCRLSTVGIPLRRPAYQLCPAPHLLQPAIHPLFPTEVTPK
jgi:hypothetical protein